ncbi:DUF5819 family protein [Streptomyces caniscabiei]|uniref:DUF5819 family protein n=1 Tax=Streptomyces caniscabiei TaxID=2746961 RepID=UPI0029B744F7|nr:DUF5819 family protein [Streptomyces caniscabiei]MDX2601802.1 DUF5819 family protein [Streptomyces caniscabiei]MDX2737237.1 DUF5819 family protein [Streptomyces caniscabiei]MDX2779459.1 DUF5819 family protein [Streptomyces caniscabiei]
MDANDEVSNARQGPDEPESDAATGSDPASESGAASASDTSSKGRPSREAAVPGDLPPSGHPLPPPPADSSSGPPVPAPAEPPAASRSEGIAGPARPVSGIAALTLPYQIAVALVLAIVAVAACAHLGLVFLHIAPSNTLTKQHGQAVDEWVYPEFEQNWKLFAPNPLQQNIAVQSRAEVRTADGEVRTTGWYDLSALDGAAIDRNPVPSHTQQNELRRAWDFYTATHDSEHRATTSRGDLSERYVRRIVVMRLDRERAAGPGGEIERIQLRSRTTNVQPPEWSEEKVPDKPVVRELPWWSVTDDDRADAAAGAAGADGAEGAEGADADGVATGRTEASAR